MYTQNVSSPHHQRLPSLDPASRGSEALPTSSDLYYSKREILLAGGNTDVVPSIVHAGTIIDSR